MAQPENCPADLFLPSGRVKIELMAETSARALTEALRFAQSTRWDMLRSPHLFMGLLAAQDPGVSSWGQQLGANLPGLLDQFHELFTQESIEEESVLALSREFMSDSVISLLRESYRRAMAHDRTTISAIDLLITMFTMPESVVASCFAKIGVAPSFLANLAVKAEQKPSNPPAE